MKKYFTSITSGVQGSVLVDFVECSIVLELIRSLQPTSLAFLKKKVWEAAGLVRSIITPKMDRRYKGLGGLERIVLLLLGHETSVVKAMLPRTNVKCSQLPLMPFGRII